MAVLTPLALPSTDVFGRKFSEARPTQSPKRLECTNIAHIGDSTTEDMMGKTMLTSIGLRYKAIGWPRNIVDAGNGRSIKFTSTRGPTISIGGKVTTRPTKGARRYSGLDAVTKIKSAGFKGCWVIALGTNDSAFVAMDNCPYKANNIVCPPWTSAQKQLAMKRIRSLLDALDGDPVVFVNVWMDNNQRCGLHYPVYNSAAAKYWNFALTTFLARHPTMFIYDWATAVKENPKWLRRYDCIHFTPTGYIKRAQLISAFVSSVFTPN